MLWMLQIADLVKFVNQAVLMVELEHNVEPER